MPSVKMLLQMSAITLGVIAVANNVPAIGRLIKG